MPASSAKSSPLKPACKRASKDLSYDHKFVTMYPVTAAHTAELR
jgi:hypothetical protein